MIPQTLRSEQHMEHFGPQNLGLNFLIVFSFFVDTKTERTDD